MKKLKLVAGVTAVIVGLFLFSSAFFMASVLWVGLFLSCFILDKVKARFETKTQCTHSEKSWSTPTLSEACYE